VRDRPCGRRRWVVPPRRVSPRGLPSRVRYRRLAPMRRRTPRIGRREARARPGRVQRGQIGCEASSRSGACRIPQRVQLTRRTGSEAMAGLPARSLAVPRAFGSTPERLEQHGRASIRATGRSHAAGRQRAVPDGDSGLPRRPTGRTDMCRRRPGSGFGLATPSDSHAGCRLCRPSWRTIRVPARTSASRSGARDRAARRRCASATRT
jgi:hypothetical protein